MLRSDPLRDRIVRQFKDMSPQLQQAARYVLDHPQEVALVSMRELSRSAGVLPSTMTRLAKFLGLQGYDDIRAHYAQAIRLQVDGFAASAMKHQEMVDDTGDESFSRRVLQNLSAQLAWLSEPQSLERLSSVANRLAEARHIYVLGLRSCHLVAWHFHYVMGLLSHKTIHLDGPAGTMGDGLIWAGAEDVILVVSIKPYALQTLELARIARGKGLRVLSITDNEVSPLVAISDQVIFCPADSHTMFHTLTPMLAVSEVLCGLLANRDRSAALDALQKADRHLSALNTFAITTLRHRKGDDR